MMNKGFFNIIPSADSACLLIYGEIGEWGSSIHSGDIMQKLMELALTYKKIDVRINSIGGEVLPGIAIFNALRNIEAEITIYIDGVAASMASAIAMCGRRVEMGKYARMMIHSVSGGAYGNKNDIENALRMLESLEDTLCEIYADRTKQTPEQIRDTYFDGTDHWLTAEEALKLGFIDAIFDIDPVPGADTPNDVYKAIQNRFMNQNNNDMIEKLRKRPSFANVATDEDALARIENFETEAAKVPGLEAENKRLKDEAEARRVADEEAADAEIDAQLEQAVAENRITTPEKAEFKAMFKATPEVAKAQLARRKSGARIVDVLKDGKGEGFWDKKMDEIREKTNR